MPHRLDHLIDQHFKGGARPAALTVICLAAPAEAQNFSSEDLARRTIERRAVEAAIWGMPPVNTDAMRQAYFRDVGAKCNDICYFSKPQDWKFQVTPPNASTNYIYFNYNLTYGPVVIEIPAAVDAGLLGSMVDAWDEPMADGFLFRTSRGHGGTALADQPMAQADAWRMVRKRALAAGIMAPIGNHSFRATGITAYLANGGALEHAQAMAAHESPRTTKLYDRTKERLTQDEVERIRL